MTTHQKYLECLESAALAGNLVEVERLTRNARNESITNKNIIAKIISAGQTEAAKFLINRGYFFYNNTFSKENEILHSAILTGDLELVQLLIVKVKLSTKLLDKDGIPPIFKIVHITSDNVDYSKFLDCFLAKESQEERINTIIAKRQSQSFTILHYAAEIGNAKIIPVLIDKHCKINLKLSDGSTALHIAVKNRHSQVVRELLKHKAKDSLVNNENKTALHLAAETGDFGIFGIFVNHMRSIRQTLQRQINRSLVYLATSAGNAEMVQLLLFNGAVLTYTSKETKQTALHLAVEREDVQIVKLLLKYEAELEILDKTGFSPLHVACIKGNIQILSMILKARKCCINVKTDKGLTALHLAVKEGHLQLVSLLLEKGAECNQLDNSNKTPLSYALENTSGDKKILILFLKHIRQAENNDSLLEEDNLLIKYHTEARNDKNGNSILHLAVEKEDKATVKQLLKLRSCLDVLNKNGYTPLDLATVNGSFSVVDIFLKSRLDPKALFVSTREDGFTPMHFAVKEKNVDMLEAFFTAGISADLPYRSKTSINNFKLNGLSPLHVAVLKGDKNLIYLLLKNGAEVDVSGRAYFETPLFTAAEYGNTEVLEILSEASTSRSSKWEEGYLPMCIAAYRGHERIVRMLLDKGVDPNANLDTYMTPLHAAAQQGYENIVSLLFEHGAMVNPKHKKREFISTPLLGALFAKHTKIAQVLLNQGADFNAQLLALDRDFLSESNQSVTDSSVLITRQILEQGNYKDSEIEKEGSLIGYRSIHFVVESEDEEAVKLLLNSGANVNFIAKNRATPIGLAIEKENEAIIKLLLSAGANVLNLHKEKSILDIGVLKTNVQIAEIIVKYVSSSYPCSEDVSVTPLGIAVENELELCVERLLQVGASLHVEHNKESLLHIAVRKKNTRIIKLLLDHGFDVNYVDSNLNFVFLTAVKNEDASTVELLLDAGGNIRIRESLYKAIEMKNATIVEMFLKREFNYSDSKYKSPFRQALMESSPQVVEKFLKYKASTDLKEKKGESPIFYAMEGDNLEVVEFLIKAAAAENVTTNKGETILHFVMNTAFFMTNLYETLVDYNVDLSAPNTENHSLLVRILKTNYVYMNIDKKKRHLLNILLSNGVSPNQFDAFERLTMIEHAILNQNFRGLEALILNGADINVLNSKNKTPLKVAVDTALKVSKEIFKVRVPIFIDKKHVFKDLDNLEYDRHFGDIEGIYPSRIVVRQLVQEVARRLAANEEVNKKDRTLIVSQYLKKYYEECVKEIDLMKVTEICKGVSYFKILVSKFNGLADYARSVQVKQVLLSESNVTKLFPKYGTILIERIVIGRDRRHLLDSSYHLLKVFLRFDFPRLIVDHIFSFLRNKDLRNLNTASENL